MINFFPYIKINLYTLESFLSSFYKLIWNYKKILNHFTLVINYFLLF